VTAHGSSLLVRSRFSIFFFNNRSIPKMARFPAPRDRMLASLPKYY
jgi:hypothetical protein